MIIASVIALTLLALLSLFQMALVFGAPLGHFAWGGQHRVLPKNLRIGSIVSMLLYVGFAILIVSKTGFFRNRNERNSHFCRSLVYNSVSGARHLIKRYFTQQARALYSDTSCSHINCLFFYHRERLSVS
jgi:hypothetical protein